jgi:hypothetical protein
MRTSTLVVLLLFFTAEFTVLPLPQVLAGPAEDVQSAMQFLKSKAAAFGVPNIKGDDTVAEKTSLLCISAKLR